MSTAQRTVVIGAVIAATSSWGKVPSVMFNAQNGDRPSRGKGKKRRDWER